MLWLICYLLSIACLVGMILFCIGAARGLWGKRFKGHLFKILFATVFFSSAIMFLPVNSFESPAGFWGILRSALLSLFTAMQTFGMGCEYEVIKAGIADCPPCLNSLYQVWSSVLFVIAPVFTFGFALSFFKNVISHIRYRVFYRNRDVYIFSEVNERSVALARSIKENKGRSSRIALVFTDVFEINEESNFELMDQVKKLGAISFKNDILVVDFSKHSAKKSISFFAIGEDQTENLNQTIKLIERYKDRDHTNVYFFSTNIQSEILFSALDKGKIKARRINEVRSLINRVLYEKGEMFFDVDQRDADGNKHISAMIIGMGQHGTEMVKALSWFCQMEGYSFEINAFDKDKHAKGKFKAQAPALLTPEYNINIHSGYDVDTARFAKAVSKIDNTSYILVALGDDDKNISTAVYLRMCFERLGKKPIIQAIVYNTHQKKALQGITNFKKQEYKIDFIGDLETSYSEDVIVNSALESEALKVHMLYSNDPEEFWSYEYNYRSSAATAIHNRAKVKCNVIGMDKPDSERTDEERERLERLEHRRWNAYMHSEGYIYSGSNDSKSRNDLAKMHHNITHYDELSDEDKRKDSRVATK